MKTTFASVSYSESRLAYHIEWATKCRYNMFRFEKYKVLLEAILFDICARHGMKMLELSIMAEHVHMIVVIPPTMAVSDVLRYLRGGSAYALFRAEPNFRLRYSRGHFWSGSKFVRTVGSDIEVAKDYVRSQSC